MTEHEFVKGIINRDLIALQKLTKIAEKQIFKTCFSFVRNFHDAQDLTQEVYLEIFKSIYTFKFQSNFTTWIYRIAINKSLNLIRTKNKHNVFNSMDLSMEVPDKDMNFTEKYIQDEENILKKKIIFQAIDNLPERQKTAFLLNKYQDFTYSEIAEIMEITYSAVESLIHRAKTTLQVSLKIFYKKIKT